MGAQAVSPRRSLPLFASVVAFCSGLLKMAMRGALQLSRRLSATMRIEPVEFTKSRFARRSNLMDEDRVKWYNWNLACIAITAVPFVWMYTVNYQTCEEVPVLYRCLNPTRDEKIKYDLKMYG